jgi:hypothetical protein
MNEKQIEAEVARILAMSDDEQIDELTVRIEALRPDREKAIIAHLLSILPEPDSKG